MAFSELLPMSLNLKIFHWDNVIHNYENKEDMF